MCGQDRGSTSARVAFPILVVLCVDIGSVLRTPYLKITIPRVEMKGSHRASTEETEMSGIYSLGK